MTVFILFYVIFLTFFSSCFGQTTPSGIHDSTIWTPYYLSSTTGYNFNDYQERYARQLQASFQNPNNNGQQNSHQYNQNVRNYQNPFERQNENNRYNINHQNGQQQQQQQQQQQNGYEYPSQFFQQRRGENLNNQYPNNQFGQHPFGSSSYQQNGNNQGQYRKPQPYEPGYYQSTTTPQGQYGIGGQQRIIQEFQQRQTERQQRPNNYGNPPQGLVHQQQGAYNHENQGGLSEYLRQVHQGMYGKKK